VLTNSGAQIFEAQVGQPVLNDVHGVMTFECEPGPRFVSVGATVSVGRSAEHLAQAIANAREIGASMSGAERLAYDLYSASALPAADARFVMLMMAVETLIEPAPRSDAVRIHVEQLIARTKEADLPTAEKDSVVGSLRSLMDLPGGTAASREPRQPHLHGSDGGRVLQELLRLRSRLVHGYYPRPAVEEVNARCAPLELFVGDLLAGELKDG
jgi:hypothetical protein